MMKNFGNKAHSAASKFLMLKSNEKAKKFFFSTNTSTKSANASRRPVTATKFRIRIRNGAAAVGGGGGSGGAASFKCFGVERGNAQRFRMSSLYGLYASALSSVPKRSFGLRKLSTKIDLLSNVPRPSS